MRVELNSTIIHGLDPILTHLTHWWRNINASVDKVILESLLKSCRLFGTKRLAEPWCLIINWPLGTNFNEIWVKIRSHQFNVFESVGSKIGGHLLLLKMYKTPPPRVRHLWHTSRNAPVPYHTNAPFKAEMYIFLASVMHCGIWDRCVVPFVN